MRSLLRQLPPEFTNEPIPHVCLGTTVSYSYGGSRCGWGFAFLPVYLRHGSWGNLLAYVFPLHPLNEPITGLTLGSG